MYRRNECGTGGGSDGSLAPDCMPCVVTLQGLAAYALGSSLVESRATVSKMWSVLLFFAVATPVG